MATTTASKKYASRNGHAGRRLTLAGGDVESLSKGVALVDIDEKGWQKWQQHLKRRRHPQTLAQLTETTGLDALCWAMPNDVDDSTLNVLKRIETAIGRKASDAKRTEKQVQRWLETQQADGAQGTSEVGFALETLAWAHALPALAKLISPALWCELLTVLLQSAEEAPAISLEKNPLAHQLLAGELPLALAYLLPEINECRTLNKPARAALAEGALTILDGEGLPHGKFLSLARCLLACWTRATLLGGRFKKGCFDEAAREQYEWLVRQSLRLVRPDGGQMLADERAGAWSKSLQAAALAAGGDAADRRIASLTLPGKSGGKTPSAKTTGKGARRVPDPAVNSEWAEVAVLRTSWSPLAPRLAVNYHNGRIRTELCADRHVIWSGNCDPRVSVAGERLALPVDWEEICWFSDEDVDYLEIEAALTGDWKVQRQFLLARKDLFLLVADAVLGPQEEDLRYQCTWPTRDSVRLGSERETTEFALVAGKRKFNALPLALPEWRSDGRRAGELITAEEGLCYELARRGRRLYAPLLIDLNPARAKREFTWRQLTVGENLQPCRPDVAVGYRVQLGVQHWLIYRSLAAVGSRTVLGQNTYHEFICGRFDCEGEVDSLIEIE